MGMSLRPLAFSAMARMTRNAIANTTSAAESTCDTRKRPHMRLSVRSSSTKARSKPYIMRYANVVPPRRFAAFLMMNHSTMNMSRHQQDS